MCSKYFWITSDTVFLAGSRESLPSSPVIDVIFISFELFNLNSTSSPGFSTAKPRTSKPHATFAHVAGAKAFIDFSMDYPSVEIFIISANTPAAVTSAPAPGPFITKGFALYLSVVYEIMLSLPDREKNG